MRLRCRTHGYQDLREDPHVEATREPTRERVVIVTDLMCGCEVITEKKADRE